MHSVREYHFLVNNKRKFIYLLWDRKSIYYVTKYFVKYDRYELNASREVVNFWI
jgi:hypothetical protein